MLFSRLITSFYRAFLLRENRRHVTNGRRTDGPGATLNAAA